MACATQTVLAQFFSNNLQDEASATNMFNVNLASEGRFGFSADPVITVLNPTNTSLTVERTNLTAGASVFATSTNDNDNVRSYLATTFGGYSTNSWKAKLSLESPTDGDPNQNYIFIGLGEGVPSGSGSEPVSGDRAYVRWRHGSGASYGRPRTYLNGSAIETSGTAASSIGADVFLTYSADTGYITFEIDNWDASGVADGVDITMNLDASSLSFSEHTQARIFFGGNATVTYSDFSVEEYIPTAPTMPLNVYAWPDSNDIVTVRWDEELLSSDGYNIYRSVEDELSYSQVASAVMQLSYVDTDVTNGVRYYYKVAGTNEFGEGVHSESDAAVPTPYLILGTDETVGDNPDLSKYSLFDGDIDTYFDTAAYPSFVGLDYGEGNAKEILQVHYTFRNWSSAKPRMIGATVQGANSADFSDAVTLHTVTDDDLTYPASNEFVMTNSAPFRYVRMLSSDNGRPLYGFTELTFITEEDFTANGTLKSWLKGYGLTEADDEVDNDGDGLLTWEEYVAGTNPTDETSTLSIISCSNTAAGMVISWQSVEGKNYSIYTNTSLTVPQYGVAVSNITGLATETSYTSTVSSAGTVFYEIGVE